MTTLKRQFQNDQSDTSEAYESLDAIIKDLATASKINLNDIKPLSSSRWREVIAQQVMTAISVGDQKKNVPVLRGLPGVGKTSIGVMFEEEPYNLRFIHIDCSLLTAEEFVGVTVPDELPDGGVDTDFTGPKLYADIMKSIQKAENKYMESLKKQEKDGELGDKTAQTVFNMFKKQKYQYMIMLDEINRVPTVAVFNSARQLILEKKFNQQYKLPKEALVIAAMNPDDVGTLPMTDHFRDAVDMIDVMPTWSNFLLYLKNQVIPRLKKLNNNSDTAIEMAMHLIEEFTGIFSPKNASRDINEFYANMGGDQEIYISPRDYEDLLASIAQAIDSAINRIGSAAGRGEPMDQDKKDEEIARVAYGEFEGIIDHSLTRLGIDAPQFKQNVQTFIQDQIKRLIVKKTAVQTLGQMFEDAINDITSLTDDIDFMVYLDNYRPNVYARDLRQFLTGYFKSVSTDQEISDKQLELDKLFGQLAIAVVDNNYNRDIFDRTLTALEEINQQLFLQKDASGNDLFEVATVMKFYDFYMKLEKRFRE
jgi:MoxR-like ATPase